MNLEILTVHHKTYKNWICKYFFLKSYNPETTNVLKIKIILWVIKTCNHYKKLKCTGINIKKKKKFLSHKYDIMHSRSITHYTNRSCYLPYSRVTPPIKFLRTNNSLIKKCHSRGIFSSYVVEKKKKIPPHNKNPLPL